MTSPDGSVTALVEATLRSIDDDLSNCFAEVIADRAQTDALAQDQQRLAGRPPLPLAGVCVGIKELFDVAGADNSYGSLVRAGSRADKDAAVVERLRRSGAIVVGTTRSHEFGWGITTQSAHAASTTNPWNPCAVPGGSSGGSAAAVASGLVPLAVGSDTGGSIRIPAAFCGVLGLKTTWGRVSRRGGVALAPSFDTPGFLAREPHLLTAAFLACAGSDPSDSATELDHRLFRSAPEPRPLQTLRVGIDIAQRRIQTSPARLDSLTGFSDALRAAGLEVSDIEGPDPDTSYSAFVPYQMAEAHDIHHRVLGTYPSSADRYGADVRGRLQAAAGVTPSQYLAARATAQEVFAHFLRLFEEVDILLSVVGLTGPSSTQHPDLVNLRGEEIPLRDSVMPTTVPHNLAGLPSITLPFGEEGGVPIGLQLTGPPNSELMLLDAVSSLHAAGTFSVPTPPSFVGTTD